MDKIKIKYLLCLYSRLFKAPGKDTNTRYYGNAFPKRVLTPACMKVLPCFRKPVFPLAPKTFDANHRNGLKFVILMKRTAHRFSEAH